MTLDTTTIQARLLTAMPDALTRIEDPRGDGAYLIVHVSSTSFTGLTQVERHRLVYKAIGEPVLDPPPVISLRTTAQDEAR